MNWRIEVSTREEFPDTHGQALLRQVRDLGISSVQALRSIRVFLIDSEAERSAIDRAAGELLADPVTEHFHIGQSRSPAGPAKVNIVEVHLKPGVMDPVAGSTLMALADMNIKADSVRVVGTNTLRRVGQHSDFVARAEAAIGHPVEIISGIRKEYKT